jgi:small subunit ribosomal protein SAe
MIYWLLAREVKILRGELKSDEEWDEFVDLFYYRNVEEEIRKEPTEEVGEEKEADQQDAPAEEQAGNAVGGTTGDQDW